MIENEKDRCVFSKVVDGVRIHCSRPAEKVYRGSADYPCHYPVCLKHYLKWTQGPQIGDGLGVEGRTP